MVHPDSLPTHAILVSSACGSDRLQVLGDQTRHLCEPKKCGRAFWFSGSAKEYAQRYAEIPRAGAYKPNHGTILQSVQHGMGDGGAGCSEYAGRALPQHQPCARLCSAQQLRSAIGECKGVSNKACGHTPFQPRHCHPWFPSNDCRLQSRRVCHSGCSQITSRRPEHQAQHACQERYMGVSWFGPRLMCTPIGHDWRTVHWKQNSLACDRGHDHEQRAVGPGRRRS